MTVAAPELRARRAVRWAASDNGALWAFRAALVLAIPVFYVIGRHQWFTRDDWGYVLSRQALRGNEGLGHFLFDAQDGHWLTIPVLIFDTTRSWFGLDSYWPFLLPTMLAHVAAVVLTRKVCQRLRVSAWTTTLICTMLLFFGSGWDNIVFAIQICYNLSIVLFLAQLLLIDHDGPVDRRDYAGAVLGVISVMSSGFGPIFLVGIFVVLLLRRRWKALLIAVVPQALAYLWWLVTWATDSVAEKMPGDRMQLPAYLVRGVTATFEAMVGIPALAGVAIVATIAMSLWRGRPWAQRSALLAMWAVVVVMFVAIGFERIGFGVPTAASSRYLHVAAIVIAPAFAITVDRLRSVSAEARWAAWAVLVVSIAVNLGALRTSTAKWASDARQEQQLFEWIYGSGAVLTADPGFAPSPFSPNVTIAWLPTLVELGAITPRVPATDQERQRLADALVGS